MARVGLLIFDCDGVLVDNERIVNRVIAEVKTELGFPITTEEQIRRFVGLAGDAADRLADYARLPPEFYPTMRARVREAYRAELRAMPGIHEALDALPHPRCVASGSEPDALAFKLGFVGLDACFAGRVYSSQAVGRSKPAPDVFLYAAERHGVPPAECLVIEDSLPGVLAARAAGMPVLGFVGGSHILDGHAGLLREAGAADVFARMADLPILVSQRYG